MTNVPAEPTGVTGYFSFGHGQNCPITGKKLIGHHVAITAPTFELARRAMFQVFGQAWSMPYSSLEALTRNGQYPSTEYMRIQFNADPDATEYERELDVEQTGQPVPAHVEGHPEVGHGPNRVGHPFAAADQDFQDERTRHDLERYRASREADA